MGEISRFIRENFIIIIFLLFLIFLFFAYVAFQLTIVDIIIIISEYIDIIMAILLVFAPFLLVGVTYLYYRTSQKTMWHQSLLEFQKEYREKDMRDAVSYLWIFFRHQCDKDETILKGIFRFILENEIDLDLDLCRRKVFMFYLHLAILYKHEILSKNIIYDMFPRRDLEIIPKIIIPLCQELQDHLDYKGGQELSELESKSILSDLYNDSPQ